MHLVWTLYTTYTYTHTLLRMHVYHIHALMHILTHARTISRTHVSPTRTVITHAPFLRNPVHACMRAYSHARVHGTIARQTAEYMPTCRRVCTFCSSNGRRGRLLLFHLQRPMIRRVTTDIAVVPNIFSSSQHYEFKRNRHGGMMA